MSFRSAHPAGALSSVSRSRRRVLYIAVPIFPILVGGCPGVRRPR